MAAASSLYYYADNRNIVMVDTPIHLDGVKFSAVILFITQEYPKVTTS